MSSISCWTSATRCSNSSVSHPTSNSYPPPLSVGPFIGGNILLRYPYLPALHLRVSPSIRDSADRFVCLDPWSCRVTVTGGFNRARRRHFEVDVTARTRHESCGQQQAAQTAPDCFLISPYLFTLIHSRWPVPFRLLILPLHHPLDMRRDVQEIFRATPHHKQVMMFSATLAKDIRVTCKKFMANVGGPSTCRILSLNIPYSLLKFLSMMRQS